MAVHNHHSVIPLPHKRMGDVIDKIHKYGLADAYGAREAHVVFIEAIVDHGRGQDLAVGSPGSFFRHVLHQQIVYVDGQMIAVLLNSSHWNHNYRALLGAFAGLRPGELAIEEFGIPHPADTIGTTCVRQAVMWLLAARLGGSSESAPDRPKSAAHGQTWPCAPPQGHAFSALSTKFDAKRIPGRGSCCPHPFQAIHRSST